MSLAHNTIGKGILRRAISDNQHITVTDGWLILHYWVSFFSDVMRIAQIPFPTINGVLFVYHQAW